MVARKFQPRAEYSAVYFFRVFNDECLLAYELDSCALLFIYRHYPYTDAQ